MFALCLVWVARARRATIAISFLSFLFDDNLASFFNNDRLLHMAGVAHRTMSIFHFSVDVLPKTNLVSSAPGAEGRDVGLVSGCAFTARAPGLARRNFPTFFQRHPPCLWQESVHAEVLGGCMSIRTNVIGSLQGRFASPSSRT